MRLNYAGAAPRILAGSDRQGGRPRVFPRGRLSFAGSSNFLPFADDRDLPCRLVMRALCLAFFHPITWRSFGFAYFQKMNHLGFFGAIGGLNRPYQCLRAVTVKNQGSPTLHSPSIQHRRIEIKQRWRTGTASPRDVILFPEGPGGMRSSTKFSTVLCTSRCGVHCGTSRLP